MGYNALLREKRVIRPNYGNSKAGFRPYGAGFGADGASSGLDGAGSKIRSEPAPHIGLPRTSAGAGCLPKTKPAPSIAEPAPLGP